MKKVMMVCGGTGGHIYPALAIADSLRTQGVPQILFAGRKDSMEAKLVSPYYPQVEILAVPLRRGSLVQNLGLPFNLLRSLLRARQVLKSEKPQAVIATGGYVSLPIVIMAGWMKIPVFLQEQNAVAGIANRLGARYAQRIFVTSQEAADFFGASKCTVLGNPVRALPAMGTLPAPQEADPTRKTILILGGSQGAKGINEKMLASLHRIGTRQDVQVFWQAGVKNVQPIQQQVQLPANVKVFGFLEGVYQYIDHADVVVSRAGASTLAELLAFGKAMILFPFPFATANHQEFNARVVEKAGAAWVELDSDPNELWDKVEKLLDAPELLQQMAQAARTLGMPDAADRIAAHFLKEMQS